MNQQKTQPNESCQVFVQQDGTAAITCRACYRVKTASVAAFKGKKHTITARCLCGNLFPVQLDFRKHYRKKTKLPGIFSISGQGYVLITNISCGGLQFIRTGVHTFVVGQRTSITFALDDIKRTELTKIITICSISGCFFGCQFSKLEPLEQSLRFYLFP